jgi:hypothetical protein
VAEYGAPRTVCRSNAPSPCIGTNGGGGIFPGTGWAKTKAADPTTAAIASTGTRMIFTPVAPASRSPTRSREANAARHTIRADEHLGFDRIVGRDTRRQARRFQQVLPQLDAHDLAALERGRLEAGDEGVEAAVAAARR